MKRCFSLALILALLAAMIACPALAEEEVVSGNVEAEVAPAQVAGDTGLTVDGAPPDAGEGESDAALGEAGLVLSEDSGAVEAEADAPAPEDTAAPGIEAEDAPQDAAEDASDETPKAAPAFEINLSAVSIGIGETFEGLRAVDAATGEVLSGVSWITSSKKIAKVNATTGAVTGVRAGSCSVTATCNGKTATCKVTVAKKPGKVTLSSTSLTVSVGMTKKLKASLPKGTASGRLTFVSSRPKCVSVEENGRITALAAGTATITVSTYNGKTAKCKVTVRKAPAGVGFPAESLSIAVGQKVKLNASATTVSGKATPASITYAIDAASPDAGCVTLNASTGAVKGVRRGQAVITATTQNGMMAACTVTVDVAPQSVKLNRKAVSIGLGEKYAGLSATCAPPAGANTCATAVTWTSDNKKIATVDADGTVTGVKAGNCTVTVKTANGKTATCKITVVKKPAKVTLSVTSLTLTVGMTKKLKASLPKGSASGKLTFASNKPACVSVEEDGRITALAPGDATVTVSTYNGKTAKCKVTVKEAPAGVGFPAERLSIAVDQKIKLNAAATAADGESTPASITYAIDAASRDAGCVTLNASTGLIQGVREGQAVITATTQNGMMAACTVTVDIAPQSVKLNKTEAAIGVGEKYAALSATCTPPTGADTCATAVSWTSSNTKVATVDARGAVTGVKAGSCTVTATAAGGKTATCKITVKKAPDGLTVKPAVGALKVGQTGKYEVALDPSDSASRLFYESSDPKIADVDEDGYVTAIAPGEVTVTVSTFNGKRKEVSLVVSENNGSGDDDGGGDDSGKTSAANAKKLEYVISVAKSQLGKPYVYGSGYTTDSDPRGFDCSGFVYWCFLHIDIKLKDTAYKQGYDDSLEKITDKSKLRPGDLVFFDTVDDSDKSDHSAIYLGDGKFIHSTSVNRKGIVISDMSTSGSYYDRVFSWGRRVLD